MSSLCGPDDVREAPLQHARRSRRCRRPTASSASRKARLSASLRREASRRRPRSRSASPRPAGNWPMRADHFRVCRHGRSAGSRGRACNGSSASRCTLVTSGQVASSENRLRRCGFGRHDCAARRGRRTPPARGVVRNFVQFLDENRALGPQAVDHVAVVHDLVADIDRRAVDRQRRSTISMARSTPAQKPRGEQSRIFRAGLAGMGASRDRITHCPRSARLTVNSQSPTWDCFRAVLSRPCRRIARPAPDGLYSGQFPSSPMTTASPPKRWAKHRGDLPWQLQPP